MLKSSGVGTFTIPTAPSAGTAITAGAASVYSTNYVQLIASTASAQYITGLTITSPTATSVPTYVNVQLATGAAASETIVGQIQVSPNSATTTTAVKTGFVQIYPWISVANATRIAAKVADSIGGLAWSVSLNCIAATNIVVDGNVKEQADVQTWLASAVTAATAGIPDVNTKNINNVAAATPGAAGGVLISGSNAGTTTLGALTVTGATTHTGATVHTGNVLLSDGLTIAAPSTANRAGMDITGIGTAAGVKITGGAAVTTTAGGHGVLIAGGASSTGAGGTAGIGISIIGGAGSASVNGAVEGVKIAGGGTNTVASAAHGLNIVGASTGAGTLTTGGATGIGLSVVGGGTSGDGVKVTTTSGHGLNLAPVGTSMHGIFATGGNAGTSDGIKATAGTGGVDFRANQTGNLTGTVATLTTYTGNTPQTGDNFARLGAPAGASVSADIAAAKVDTAAIKVKADFLPSATAGAAGGVFIAGTNAATTITTGLTTTFTGNLTGSVGSVTGAVGSVTGLTASNLDAAVSSRMASYTQPTGFLAATFPGTVASPTNITAGVITTATTVTNQLTAAQIATGVWQDTTAGDFTTALSVGKSVMNGVALGTGLTVAAVSGAAGSVTGSVGSVTGAVGSVTAQVNANVAQINGVTVTGAGTAGSKWGP